MQKILANSSIFTLLASLLGIIGIFFFFSNNAGIALLSTLFGGLLAIIGAFHKRKRNNVLLSIGVLLFNVVAFILSLMLAILLG